MRPKLCIIFMKFIRRNHPTDHFANCGDVWDGPAHSTFLTNHARVPGHWLRKKKFSLADVSRSSCKNSWDQRRQLSILKYVPAFISCMDAFMELKQLTVCNSWHYSKSNHIPLPAALWVQQWKYFTLYSSRTERQLERSTTKTGGTEQLQSACCVRTLC